MKPKQTATHIATPIRAIQVRSPSRRINVGAYALGSITGLAWTGAPTLGSDCHTDSLVVAGVLSDLVISYDTLPLLSIDLSVFADACMQDPHQHPHHYDGPHDISDHLVSFSSSFRSLYSCRQVKNAVFPRTSPS